MENIVKNIKEKVKEGLEKKKEIVENPSASVNPKDLEVESQITEEGIEEVESTEEVAEETETPKQQVVEVPVPVFLTQADKDKMIYETNQMVKMIFSILNK